MKTTRWNQTAVTFTASTFIVLMLVAAPPLAAQGGYSSENGFRISAGLFEPEGDSEYWRGNTSDFTGETSDFEDVVGGLEYVHELRGGLRLLVGGTVFEGSTEQAYRDFEDGQGGDIVHDTTLSMATATAALAVRLAPRRSPVIPYLGVGVGLYSWNLEESGDFIDFGAQPLEIFTDTFEDEGVVAGWFWLAGLEVPVGSSLSVFAQGRWHHAEDDLEDDFSDLGKIDLGGRELTAGLTWRF